MCAVPVGCRADLQLTFPLRSMCVATGVQYADAAAAAQGPANRDCLLSRPTMDGFSAMLCGCLRERFMARCLFIQHPNSGLRSRFPDRIRIFAVESDGSMQAGVCVYDTGIVAHA